MLTLSEIDLAGIKTFKKGKVRNIYEIDDKSLLIVTTDRVSAFDFILPDPIPNKGKLLTEISKFWFDKLDNIVENHLISVDLNDLPKEFLAYQDLLQDRFMIVKKAELIPIECIVRGYLSGSGWAEYQQQQSICGIELPAGMQESEKLISPIFTPSTKAEIGEHDENITFLEAENIIGKSLAAKIKDLSLEIYRFAHDYAIKRGIIIADTKFEFGLVDDQVILIDEVLTPDSSRFWPLSDYAIGRAQKSFDKQFIRDYLLGINWDKKPPVPNLPQDIILNTSQKYQEAYQLLANN